MSSTLEQTSTVPAELAHAGPSPAAVLIDRLPDSWKFSPATAGLTVLLGLFFLFLNYQPLAHVEVWDHLAFGREIATNRALPNTEPFLPLLRGVSLAETTWLADAGAYLAYRQWGTASLQFLNGLLIVGCFVVIAQYGNRLRNVRWTLTGMGMFLLLNWFQFPILRPQTAGLFCFVLLVMGSTARRLQTRDWLMVPVLFAVWANVHGSFLAGLAWLACLTVGRGIDVWRRTGRFQAFLQDAWFRRLFMLTELAAVATLVTPFGASLYSQLFNYFNNTNLRDLIEWEALQIRTVPGAMTAVAVVTLGVIYRLTPRRISSAELLAHLVFGVAALWSNAFLPWWSVIMVYTFMKHGAAISQRRAVAEEGSSQRAGKWSVVTVAMIWIAFGFSPMGAMLLRGRAVESKHGISPLAPVQLAEYLEKKPISGQVFNSMEVGDYLLYAGPQNLKLFMSSHVDLAPREIWKAYLTIVNGTGDWKEQLDRYSVNAVIVDKEAHGNLISEIAREQNWRRDYEDNVAVVYVRRKPI